MTLEDELSRLIQAERAVQPPPNALATGWGRLAVDLSAGVPALPVTVAPLKMALGIVPKWFMGGFAIGLIGAGGASLAVPSPPPRAVVVASAPAGTERVPVSAPVSLVTTPDLKPTPMPVAEAPRPSHAAAAPALSAPIEPSTFDAELSLIKQAKVELDRGRPSAARLTLTQHAERFPSGAFAIERDALSMIAQCQQGPKNPGLGARFAALHPGSPLAQRVDHACAVRAPSADFPTLPNGSSAAGEPITEPSGGTK